MADLTFYGGNGLVITPEINEKNAAVYIDTYVNDMVQCDRIAYCVLDMDGKTVCECESDKTSAVWWFGQRYRTSPTI